MKYGNISVYASDETDFSYNGMCIISPLTVSVTEVLNGDYSLTMTHPKDPWGNWQYLINGNVLKVRGQLFRIFNVNKGMNSNGSYSDITVEAMHIFYDLNNYFIKDVRPILSTPAGALEWITTPNHNGYQNILNGDPRKRFDFSTDLDSTVTKENLNTAYYEKMSVTKALIGADNCFVNTWGGQIFRDNFNVEMLKRRGGDDAFSIRYGVDMTEIKVVSDSSTYAAKLYYEATIYSETISSGSQKERRESIITGIVSDESPPLNLPVQPMQVYKFEINFKDIKSEGDTPTLYEIQAELEKRAKAYLFAECQIKVNIQVKFADLKNFDIYEDFIDLQERNIGDTGTIYHEGLGINVKMQVIKKITDGLTGETIGIELGSLQRTIADEVVKKR